MFVIPNDSHIVRTTRT